MTQSKNTTWSRSTRGPISSRLLSEAQEEEKKMMTIDTIEEARIRKELQDAQQSGNKERMEKAWEDYMLLWKQKGLIR